MDATLLPFRSTPFLSGGRYGLSSSNIHRHRLESRKAISPSKFGASAKAIRSRRLVVASFADDGHASYYQSTPRATCGGSSSREAKKTTKDKGGIGGRHSESKELKKKLKRVEGLLRSTVSTMVFGEETQGEAASFAQYRVLAETAKRLILQRLQQVKAQEMEDKRRRKAEKAVKKAAVCGGRKGMRMADDSESSSSTSSESSDSERPPVLDRYRPPEVEAALPGGFVEERTEKASAKVDNNKFNNNNITNDDDEGAMGKPGILAGSMGGMMGITGGGSSSYNNNDINNNIGGGGGGGGRIQLEVCMGGKCQRSGAGRLKAELERQVGFQPGTVVGCKCMGRCKQGPNVRLRHDYGQQTPSPPTESQSQSHPSSICCVGVGLEDVPSPLSSFLLTNLHSPSASRLKNIKNMEAP